MFPHKVQDFQGNGVNNRENSFFVLHSVQYNIHALFSPFHLLCIRLENDSVPYTTWVSLLEESTRTTGAERQNCIPVKLYAFSIII
jgi:hypothetical protein